MAEVEGLFGSRIAYDPNWDGPISEDARRPTDHQFFRFFAIFYLVFWVFVAIEIILNLQSEQLAQWEMDMDFLIDLSLKNFYLIILGFGMAALMAAGVVACLQTCTPFLVWTGVVLACLALLVTTFQSIHLLNQAIDLNHPDPTEYTVDAIARTIVFAIVLFLVVKLRRRIHVATIIVREGSRAATVFPSLYFVSLIQSACNMLLTFTWALVAGFLLFSAPGYPDARVLNWLLQLVNLFGFAWLIGYVSAVARMLNSGCIASWYWTQDKWRFNAGPAFMSSTRRTFRFHLGTAALGSMLLTVSKILLYLAESIRILVQETGRFWEFPLLECCSGLFRIFEVVMSYVNQNAFITSAIHGTDYFESARRSFNLVMRNFTLTYMCNWVTKMVLFICQTLLLFLLTIFILIFVDKSKGLMNSGLVAILVVTIVGAIVTSPFFDFIQTSVDTIFLCALEDFERNDGTLEKPYFMTGNLRSLLLDQ